MEITKEVGMPLGRDFNELEKRMEAGFMSSAILERHSTGHGLAMPTWTIIPMLYHAPPDYDREGIRRVATHEATSDGNRKCTYRDQYGSTWQIDANKSAQHKIAMVTVLKHAKDGLSAMKDLRYSEAVSNFDAALEELWDCHRDTYLQRWVKLHKGHALLRAGLLQCPAIHGQNTNELLDRGRDTLRECTAIPSVMVPEPESDCERSLRFSSLLGIAWYYFFRGSLLGAKGRSVKASSFKLAHSHLRSGSDRDLDTIFLQLALTRVTGNLSEMEGQLNSLGHILSDYDEDIILVHLLEHEWYTHTARFEVCIDVVRESNTRPQMKFTWTGPQPSVKEFLEQLEGGYYGNMWFAVGARKQAKMAYGAASTCKSLLLQAAAMVGLGNVMMRDHVVKSGGSATSGDCESEQRFAAAEKKYKEALQIYDELGYKEGQIIVQCNLGNLYHKWGQVREALSGYRQAMTYFATEMRNSTTALHLHLKVAELYLDGENFDEALKSIQKAAEIPTPYPLGKAWLEQLYGAVYLRRSKTAKNKADQTNYLLEAQSHLCVAAKCFAKIQGNSSNHWAASSMMIFEQQKETYSLLLWCLACQPKAAAFEALVWCERSRSRISALQGIDSYKECLANDAVFDAFQATASKEFDNLTVEEAWKNLQLLLHRCKLSPGTVILEYALCEEFGYLIFVLDLTEDQPRMKKVSFAEQGLDRGKLNKLVSGTIHMISRSRSRLGKDEEMETNLAALYKILIEPVEEWLGKVRHIVVVPHEILFKVPFHALIDGKKKFLIEKYSVSCAESIKALVQCSLPQQQSLQKSSAAERRWLVVGVNDHEPFARNLKLAEKEAADIASMDLKSDVIVHRLLGSEATKAKVKSLLTDPDISFDVIHLATHGICNPRYERGGIQFVAPAKLTNADSTSDIVDVERAFPTTEFDDVTRCSPDDLRLIERSWFDNRETAEELVLSASEISEVRLKSTQLVVLSACQSADGVILGDGVAGLGRALLMAGVPCTVLSLWPVSDETTVDFMKKFYRELAEGHMVADAMRTAMVTMLSAHDKYSKEPKYTLRHWAAFWSFGLPVVRLQRHAQELQNKPLRSPPRMGGIAVRAVALAALSALLFRNHR